MPSSSHYLLFKIKYCLASKAWRQESSFLGDTSANRGIDPEQCARLVILLGSSLASLFTHICGCQAKPLVTSVCGKCYEQAKNVVYLHKPHDSGALLPVSFKCSKEIFCKCLSLHWPPLIQWILAMIRNVFFV